MPIIIETFINTDTGDCMKKTSLIFAFAALLIGCKTVPEKSEVLGMIDLVNNYWQDNNKPETRPFWDNAAYHTGNMEAYFLTGNEKWLNYSKAWAEHNNYCGATSNNKEEWKYTYGERQNYVLFGDWQICFQTYADLYNLEPDTMKIARAREVMEYQMSTPYEGYWWWADGLYMVMPVMTKMYNITGNQLYLDKLYEYFMYAKRVMFDEEESLFYRDAKYLFPNHATNAGLKDFWARGDGWVLAGLAKVLKDLPEDDAHRDEYLTVYKRMAEAVKNCQQPEGYWTRSMLDKDHAPGPETSGTAFFTYAILWGINNDVLSERVYWPVVERAWTYLTTVALQPTGLVGYVQPIGERAIPGQHIEVESTANFAVGAFLLAACEMVRYIDAQ